MAGADASQSGVGRLGSLAHVETEHAADARVVAGGQLSQTFGQVGMLRPERHEFIEKRHDQYRRDQRQPDAQGQVAARADDGFNVREILRASGLAIVAGKVHHAK